MTKTTTNPKIEQFWYALYTRPRAEKKVDRELQLKGIESLVPLRSVIKIWSDRKKRIQEPMFPSYVFVHADGKQRYSALQTDGVMKVVSFNGTPARIPEWQIKNINRILEHGYDPEPHHYLRYGDEVEITKGPLQGLRGFYKEGRGKNRLVISIAAIQQSMALEVTTGQVRPINSLEHRKEDTASTGYHWARGFKSRTLA